MSKLKFWKKKQKYESIDSIKSLNPSAAQELSKEATIVLAPFLALLVTMFTIPHFYYVTQIEMQLISLVGLILCICSLVGYVALIKSDAAGKKLHDREFGWDERHHPTHEIYVLPQNISRIFPIDEDVKGDSKAFEDRINSFDLPPNTKTKIIELMKTVDAQDKYVYYFHDHFPITGLDFEANAVRTFRSHVVVQDLPYDEQYSFSEGQENWYKGILFNHTNAERDAVQPLGWGLDFFNGEPMPITRLIHTSLKYRRRGNGNKIVKEDVKIQETLMMIMARQHAIIEGQRKQGKYTEELLETNFENKEKLIDLVHSATKTDIQLWLLGMKTTSKGFFRSAKGIIVTIAGMIAVVVIIALVLNWLGYVNWFG